MQCTEEILSSVSSPSKIKHLHSTSQKTTTVEGGALIVYSIGSTSVNGSCVSFRYFRSLYKPESGKSIMVEFFSESDGYHRGNNTEKDEDSCMSRE